jgi:hypothetical protein
VLRAGEGVAADTDGERLAESSERGLAAASAGTAHTHYSTGSWLCAWWKAARNSLDGLVSETEDGSAFRHKVSFMPSHAHVPDRETTPKLVSGS